LQHALSSLTIEYRLVLSIGISDFEFVSCFDIRISDFVFNRDVKWQLAAPNGFVSQKNIASLNSYFGLIKHVSAV